MSDTEVWITLHFKGSIDQEAVAGKLADIQDRVLPLGSIMAGEVKWAR